METNSPKLQIFDLDNTLLKGTSSFRFFFYLLLLRRLPLYTFFSAFFLFLSFRFGRLTLANLHHRVFAIFLRGRPKSLFQDAVIPFLDRYLHKMVDRPLCEKIQTENSVLISSSPDFLIGPIAQRLGIALFKGSEYAVDKDNLFCNISCLVDGREKLKFAKLLSDERGVAPQEISAYSDSDDDIPLLEWSGFPFAVKPNRALRKIAIQRGWKIL